jgi:hypothetical protein
VPLLLLMQQVALHGSQPVKTETGNSFCIQPGKLLTVTIYDQRTVGQYSIKVCSPEMQTSFCADIRNIHPLLYIAAGIKYNSFA